jgi:hypothetical protein
VKNRGAAEHLDHPLDERAVRLRLLAARVFDAVALPVDGRRYRRFNRERAGDAND